MAIIRDNLNPDYTLNHIATLAFFCCVSCVTLMLKFGGFKASLNLYNGRRKNKENNNNKGSEISMNGAYRTNRDEFFAHSPNPERQRKLTPSLSPPIVQTEQSLRGAKSTSDLIKSKNLPPNLRQSNPNISQDPRGEQSENTNNQSQEPKEIQKLDAEKRIEKRRQEEEKKLNKQRIEDQKKWEKQRSEEQRKREKQAAQEQAKQGKLRKEQQKKELHLEKKKKGQAPTKPLANPLAQPKPYSTNTLESSISRSSGPPPYTETLKPESVKNQSSSSSGDISFSKPIDTGSWDLISQHRQQINRPVTTQSNRKQMVMDLKYMANDKVDESRDNSEA